MCSVTPLPSGRSSHWATPMRHRLCARGELRTLVENGIVYYVSNRGELMAVDADGFRDKTNDGRVKDEKATKDTDADILWRLDMMDQLGVMQHNMANSSPVSYENMIFVSTSNGQDESHVNVPSPRSPAASRRGPRTSRCPPRALCFTPTPTRHPTRRRSPRPRSGPSPSP